MKSILELNTITDFSRIPKTLYKPLGELETIPRVGETIIADCIDEDFLIRAC